MLCLQCSLFLTTAEQARWLAGRFDDPGLSDAGQKQSQKLAKHVLKLEKSRSLSQNSRYNGLIESASLAIFACIPES
jgi:hypothetical protein